MNQAVSFWDGSPSVSIRFYVLPLGGTDVAFVLGAMGATENITRRRRFDDIPGDITTKTQAAINVVQMAKSLGFFDRLMNILSGRCAKLSGNASDPSRPVERRKNKWRDEDDQEKGIEFADHTSTDDDGESRLWDQKAIEGLRDLERRRMQRKLRQRTDDNSREN